MDLMHNLLQEELYAQYYPKVLRYITGRINSRSDAEDLASNVFLKVFNSISTFDAEKASASTWIYTITRNTLIDYFRKSDSFSPIPETEASSDNVEESFLREELLEALASALQKMEEKKRDVIILHYYKRKTLADIADMMRISYSYVKVLHRKAIDELKTMLDR